MSRQKTATPPWFFGKGGMSVGEDPPGQRERRDSAGAPALFSIVRAVLLEPLLTCLRCLRSVGGLDLLLPGVGLH
jgi:hypothetical protein